MGNANELLAVGITYWRTEGAVAMADAYKWLYQATQGAEHAVGDEAGVHAWLEREWASLGSPLAGERLFVPLRPDGQVVRLHLRPYRAAGGDSARLLDAFLESARRVHTDRQAFWVVWRELSAMLADESFGLLTHDAWIELDAVAGPQDYPAVHHSKGYRALHSLAYRVLIASEAERLVQALPFFH
jgi:hypothetical protein